LIIPVLPQEKKVQSYDKQIIGKMMVLIARLSFSYVSQSSNISLVLKPVGRGDLRAADLLQGFCESIKAASTPWLWNKTSSF
jgi:hypothetical protein